MKARSVVSLLRRRPLVAIAVLGGICVLISAAIATSCASSSTVRSASPRVPQGAGESEDVVSWPISVGAVRIHRVVETETPMAKPEGWFPAATEEGVRSALSWLEPRYIDPDTGRLIFSIQSLLIKSTENIIVVETANGNGNDGESAAYLTRLRDAGVEPEDVDIVISTHLHYDHIGWNVRQQDGRVVPTFPRAKYLFVREEWNYWRAREPGEFGQEAIERAVAPIFEAGLGEVVEPHHRIDDEVELVPVPGHTPGHVVVRVRSRGEEALVGGDVLHHPLQCAHPEWQSRFEVDPLRARETRRAFLEQYAGTDTLIIPAHFPTPGAGRVVRSGAAFRFE